MTEMNRRTFLDRTKETGVGLAAGASLLSAGDLARAAAPSNKLNIAVIGIHGRGTSLATGFAARPDCEVTYLADVDQTLLGPRSKVVGDVQGRPPQTVQDFRKVLDDKSVDAVVIATPDHWHAALTVLSCQAEKDVYVEKPASHTPWEGRKMVEAARRYKRVVQLGTQNRSAPYNYQAKEYIDSGKLGKIHMCRVYNQKIWPNVAKQPTQEPPDTLDWDMWVGPAQDIGYNRNHHDRWNHFWNFSGGDIINDGVHQIDLARWLIGRDYPKSVYSTGGRWNMDGVFETPDTQVAVYEFDDLLMTFELTLYTRYMLKTDGGIRNSDMIPYWPQNATRIELYGDQGLMFVGRHGGGFEVYDRPKDRKPVLKVSQPGRFPDDAHKENFVECIRSRDLPHADIEQGHRSTLLCQFANISYRLGGEKLVVDPKTESFPGNEPANALLKREYRSAWAIPEKV